MIDPQMASYLRRLILIDEESGDDSINEAYKFLSKRYKENKITNQEYLEELKTLEIALKIIGK